MDQQDDTIVDDGSPENDRGRRRAEARDRGVAGIGRHPRRRAPPAVHVGDDHSATGRGLALDVPRKRRWMCLVQAGSRAALVARVATLDHGGRRTRQPRPPAGPARDRRPPRCGRAAAPRLPGRARPVARRRASWRRVSLAGMATGDVALLLVRHPGIGRSEVADVLEARWPDAFVGDVGAAEPSWTMATGDAVELARIRRGVEPLRIVVPPQRAAAAGALDRAAALEASEPLAPMPFLF